MIVVRKYFRFFPNGRDYDMKIRHVILDGKTSPTLQISMESS